MQVFRQGSPEETFPARFRDGAVSGDDSERKKDAETNCHKTNDSGCGVFDSFYWDWSASGTEDVAGLDELESFLESLLLKASVWDLGSGSTA